MFLESRQLFKLHSYSPWWQELKVKVKANREVLNKSLWKRLGSKSNSICQSIVLALIMKRTSGFGFSIVWSPKKTFHVKVLLCYVQCLFQPEWTCRESWGGGDAEEARARPAGETRALSQGELIRCLYRKQAKTSLAFNQKWCNILMFPP